MGKHKTSKRERKFNAKGGVKARLDKGHTIAPKGKVKRKRRTTTDKDGPAKNKNNSKSDNYVEQQEAQRQSEDFMGSANLGGMEIEDFLANLEDDLKKNQSDDDSVESMQSDSDQEMEAAKKTKKVSDEDEVEKKAKPASNNKKNSKSKKEESDSDSDSDDSSEEEEETAKKPAKTSNKKNQKTEDLTDSDSDSDDDDIEAAEARMKAEMKKLKSEDPEFHEYLKENEEALLDFGEDNVEGSDGDDSDDDDEEEGSATKSKNKAEDGQEKKDSAEGKSIELTFKMLRDMERGAFQARGIKSLKKLVRAYKSACQVAANVEEMEGGDSKKGNQKEKKFRIESPDVFDRLMVLCLGQCHEAFHYHLLATDEEREAIEEASKSENSKEKQKQEDNKKSKKKPKAKETEDEKENKEEEKKAEDERDADEKPLDPKMLERSPRWDEVKPILHAFLKSTIQLITESKEPDLLAIVLKSFSKYIRYMTPFPRMAESTLRTLVNLWSAPLGDSSADYQVVRLNAFLRIRQLALTQPFPFIEVCLKKTYLAYARRAKYGGTGSIMTNALPTLTFMGNCLVELYSLDHQSSYQHAFVYIRQLALYLRAVMHKKTTEAFQQVYCWQFMHCLKLWVAVLSGACKQAREGTTSNHEEELMRSLVYPLTEIILGTIRLAPAPSRHVPLRFQCIRLLQQLAAASEKFIPTASLLLEVLDLKEINMKPKKIKAKGGGVTTRGVQLPFLIKLAKDDPLRTAEEQEACTAEVFKLLNREADLYRYSAGFPEYAIQITQRLKKFVKSTKNSRWRAYARGSIDLYKRNTDFAIQARSSITEAPKDVKKLECLRQAKDPSMSERYDAAVDKETKEWTSLIAAAAPAESKKRKSDDGSDEDEDENSDSEEEEEEEVIEKPKKEPKNKKRKEETKVAPPKVDKAVMDMEDTVAEGVNWSDNED